MLMPHAHLYFNKCACLAGSLVKGTQPAQPHTFTLARARDPMQPGPRPISASVSLSAQLSTVRDQCTVTIAEPKLGSDSGIADDYLTGRLAFSTAP